MGLLKYQALCRLGALIVLGLWTAGQSSALDLFLLLWLLICINPDCLELAIVVEVDPEPLILRFYVPSCGITGIYHCTHLPWPFPFLPYLNSSPLRAAARPWAWLILICRCPLRQAVDYSGCRAFWSKWALDSRYQMTYNRTRPSIFHFIIKLLIYNSINCFILI